ncbi:MAG: radical SAM family heme chaperone HemW [Bacteroidota bacterium]|jgi:oxygen-independent coproporphyrinogen-3 oxidase
MAGIYLHIPFCKQACHYCDFHFSVNHDKKNDLVAALLKEASIRKEELQNEPIKTIYFGGGTPSLLSADALLRIFDTLAENYNLSALQEVTLEANPDDLAATYLRELRHTPVNRLSIGIQSFREVDLKLMNRAHDVKQALRCVPESADIGFENISIDLIYGIQGLSQVDWIKNLNTAFDLPIAHLSSYCLTVEPKTKLAKLVSSGELPAVNDESAANHFETLIEMTEAAGIPWYEVSNFAKPGMESKHNSSYWANEHYVGLGPGAHSFNGVKRSWNVSSNTAYIQQIDNNVLPSESEVLTSKEKFNEYLLTALRTRKGLSFSELNNRCDSGKINEIKAVLQEKATQGLATIHNDGAVLTTKGLLFADAFASSLFIVS